MANINLISARRAERVRLTKIVRALMVSIVGTGVLSAGAVTYMLTAQILAAGELKNTEARLAQLRPILDEIESAERERADLQPKLTTLSQAQQKSSRWNGVMDGLKRVIPEGTWLTSVSVEGAADTGQTMKVNGITVNQSRVGETMYRLTQQSDYYSKVDLRYTRTTKVENQDNVEFELAAQLAQPQTEGKQEGSNATKTN